MSDHNTHLPRALVALVLSASVTPSLDAAGTAESPATLTADYAETTIRAIYDRFSLQTRDSGNEVTVSLSGFQTLWPEEFDDHYWVDLVTPPQGWTLSAGLTYFVELEDIGKTDGALGMYLDPQWGEKEDWLATQPAVVRNWTLQYVVDGKRLEDPAAPRPVAFTTYGVDVSFAGRARRYQAATQWLDTKDDQRSAIIHDHVIPEIMLVVGEDLEVMREHPMVSRGNPEPPPSAASCQTLDRSWDVSDPSHGDAEWDNTGHTTGRHEAFSIHSFKCTCDSGCQSRCDPTRKTRICADTGNVIGIGVCHSPYQQARGAPGGRFMEGAECASAMGCFFERCTFGCNCGGIVITIDGGPAELEINAAGQIFWSYESTPTWSCPGCTLTVEPPTPTPDVPCHDPVPQLQVEPVAGKVLPGAESLFSNFPLERFEVLEGRHYLMEEWAILVVERDAAGSLVSVEVPAASSSAYAAHQRQSLVDNSNGGIASPPAADGAERSVLLVVHHPDHPHNERWIPTPQAGLTAAALSGDAAEGRAVVRADFSENRDLRALDILYSDRPLTPEEQAHLESHLSLVYANDDRHRVVLYGVVRLGGGTIGLEGMMPLPSMCCCPSNWPNCNSGP